MQSAAGVGAHTCVSVLRSCPPLAPLSPPALLHGRPIGKRQVRVSHLGRTGHCRLGWCTRKAELQAPVGFDAFGFSYRDMEGSKVTEGRREPYGEPFVEGDVIGLYIYLPPGGKTLEPKQNE